MEKMFAGKGDDAIRGSILKLAHVTFVLAHALSLHCVGTQKWHESTTGREPGGAII
jgi:hypothetical protein